MTTRGVRLASGDAGARVGKFVHHSDEDWVITSDFPTEEVAMCSTVLDILLPGSLGRYVYPEDAVFHLLSRRATSWADYMRVLAQQKERTSRTSMTVCIAHHRTVPQTQDEDDEEDEDDEDDDDDEEEEEEDDHEEWRDEEEEEEEEEDEEEDEEDVDDKEGDAEEEDEEDEGKDNHDKTKKAKATVKMGGSQPHTHI